MLVTATVIVHVKGSSHISLDDPNRHTYNKGINGHNAAWVLIKLTCLLQSGIRKEHSDKILMDRVLSSQVRHPLELFKSCQVRKLDLSEIRHLNGMDILNLAFGIGTLISCSLLMRVEIIIKGG